MVQYRDYLLRNNAIKAFISDCKRGSASHAYMLISEDRTVLSSAATLMAQAMLCENSCGTCALCERIESGNHANVHIYGQDKPINTETAREIIAATYTTPLEKGNNIFIIANADGMSERAQNKLLKTLEEPSEGAALILTASNDATILQTIKSRCKKLYLNIWNEETILNELKKLSYNASDAEFAAKLSSGSLERGKALLSDETAKKKYSRWIQTLTRLSNSSEIPEYIGILGSNSEEVSESLDMLELIFYSIMQQGIRGENTELAAKFSVQACINIIDLIVNLKRKASLNVTNQNIESELMIGILEMRFKY